MPQFDQVRFNADVVPQTGAIILRGMRRLGQPGDRNREKYALAYKFEAEFLEDVADGYGEEGLVTLIATYANYVVAELSRGIPSDRWRVEQGDPCVILDVEKGALAADVNVTADEIAAANHVVALIRRPAEIRFRSSLLGHVSLMILSDDGQLKVVYAKAESVQ